MEILPLSFDSPAEHLEGYARLDAATFADDLAGIEPPSYDESVLELDSDLANRRRGLVAVDGGAVVGASAWWETLREERSLAMGWVVVDPSRRRHGIGRALTAATASELRRIGRNRLESSARIGSAGEAFALALGARRMQVELCNVLTMSSATYDDVPAVAPDGYELRQWEGPCPAGLVDAFAAAHMAMDDAPHGDEPWEPSVWDEARVRAEEEHQKRGGFVVVTAAAVHVASGEIGGYTRVALTGRPHTAVQLDTGVVRAHRGHGLGLLLKAANLRWLAANAPHVTTVTTWNAESNEHMMAVNRRVGFATHSRWQELVLDL